MNAGSFCHCFIFLRGVFTHVSPPELQLIVSVSERFANPLINPGKHSNDSGQMQRTDMKVRRSGRYDLMRKTLHVITGL